MPTTSLEPHDLIQDHLWIVEKFAATYQASAPGADLYAAGALGLVVAAQNYQDGRGAAFATYAWNWVKGHVLSELRRSHVVPVPEHTARRANKSGQPLRGVVVYAEPERAASDSILPPPDKAADKSMQLRALHAAIEGLESDEERQVINRTLAGRSVEQIAKGMQLSRERVRQLLADGQANLARAMEVA